MKGYYPEWAAYPAYIWRGWGYLDNTNSQGNNSNQPVENQSPGDMGSGDAGGGE